MYQLSAFADEASAQISGQIAAMKRNGISLLEIRGVDGENISAISTQKAKEVRSMLDAEGLTVWSMGSPIGKIKLSDDFDAHVETFKRLIENAQILGASKVRLFSFYPYADKSEAENLELIAQRLNTLCDLTPEGIVLCHENEKKIFGDVVERCLAVHRAVPRLRAVFDPANFIQCGVNTLEAWEAMKDYVEYVHIKDADENGIVVPAGMGLGNIETILRDYFARGGKVMTLEPHLNSFTGLDKLENGESLKPGLKVYKDNDESFDAAVTALKAVLSRIA